MRMDVMKKTILITGSTDGIGLKTAMMLAADGHHVLLHGRSAEKLAAVAKMVGHNTQSYVADLSRMSDVVALAASVSANHPTLDVLINNAGVFKAHNVITDDGLDVRFMVNTLAPYALTQRLLPLMNSDGRVINVTSAAQASVNTEALVGRARVDDMEAYSQSKLAITIWTRELAAALPAGPTVVAINPGSLLASKMVTEGFGVAGNDLSIGAKILCRAALSIEFADASGQYFDNDLGRFGEPHRDSLDATKSRRVMTAIEDALASLPVRG